MDPRLILLVAMGGAVGSVARFLLGTWVQQWSGRSDFPVGTLGVNVLGCFLIGIMAELADARNLITPETKALVVVGFLGGLTTFSSFSNETLNLARDGEHGLTALNLMLQLGLGLGAVWLGRVVVDLLGARP